MTVTRNKLINTGFMLLPWLPISIGWMTIWLHYFAPEPVAPYMMMSMTGMRTVGRTEWLAQFFPHFPLYVYFTRFAVIAFGVGLVLLVVGLCYRRSTRVPNAMPQI
jgi:hypothetical protein